MAQYNIPGQNLSMPIPDEGEVFLWGDNVGVMKGGSIYWLQDGIHGQQAKGLDLSQAHNYTEGGLHAITNQGAVGGGIVSTQVTNDINLFKQSQTTLGQSFTHSVDPNNPHAAAITNSAGQRVNPAAPAPQPGAYSGPVTGVNGANISSNLGTTNVVAPGGQAPVNPNGTPKPNPLANTGTGMPSQQSLAEQSGTVWTAQGPMQGGQPTQGAQGAQNPPAVVKPPDVNSYLSNLSTLSPYLSNIGLSNSSGQPADLANAYNDISNFLKNQKTGVDLFDEQLAKYKIPEKMGILDALDATIANQTKLLRDLPQNIQKGLADVGVTQDQLDRHVLRESQKPAEVLRDLLEQRGVLDASIQRYVGFAEKFTNLALQDQATKLAAAQWMYDEKKEAYKELKDDQRFMLGLALDERKNVLEIAEAAAKAGATQQEVDAIVKSGSVENALNSSTGVFQRSFQQEEQNAQIVKAQEVAQGISAQLTGDKTADAQLIYQAANRYGVDPQILIDAIMGTKNNNGEAPEVIGTSSTGYFQYNSQTGKWDSISNIPRDSGGGGGGGSSDPQIEQYAQDVYNGNLTLNGVPIKIRDKVGARVNELKSSTYNNEYEARVDYDVQLNQISQAYTNGELGGTPSQIIQSLVNAYGQYISKQEIEGTIRNLFGVKPQSSNTSGSSGGYSFSATLPSSPLKF